jgi:hypothetical protein
LEEGIVSDETTCDSCGGELDHLGDHTYICWPCATGGELPKLDEMGEGDSVSGGEMSGDDRIASILERWPDTLRRLAR